MFALPITLYLSTWLLISGFLLVMPSLGLSENALSYYSNATQIISSFTTAILCFRTMLAFEHNDSMRLVWLLMGAGVLSWCIGQSLYAGYIFAHNGTEAPYIWYSDIGFLLIQPFIVTALFIFIKSMSIQPPIWGMILANITLIMTLTVFQINYANLLQVNTNIERLVMIAYMLFDPILIASTVLTASLLSGEPLAYPWWFCCTGLMIYYISNILFNIKSAQGTYVSGTWTDLGWVLSFILIGTSAMLVYNTLHYED